MASNLPTLAPAPSNDNANQTDHPMPSTSTSSSSSEQEEHDQSPSDVDEDDDQDYEDPNEMFPGESGPQSNTSMMSMSTGSANEGGGIALPSDNPSTPKPQHISLIGSDELSPPNSQSSHGGGGGIPGGVAQGWTSLPQFPTINDIIQSQSQLPSQYSQSQGTTTISGMYEESQLSHNNASQPTSNPAFAAIGGGQAAAAGNAGNVNGAGAAASSTGQRGEAANDEPRWNVALSNWRDKKNREEYLRGLEMLLDQGFWGGEFGDPFDERDMRVGFKSY